MGLLGLFVYGTLEHGYWNHDHLCHGALAVATPPFASASTRGWGSRCSRFPTKTSWPAGPPIRWPMWPHRRTLRSGWDHNPTHAPKVPHGEPGAPCTGSWSSSRPQYRLPAIDRLKGIRPVGSSLYRRVLVAASVDGVRQLAWVYTVETTGIKRRRIVSGRWPE